MLTSSQLRDPSLGYVDEIRAANPDAIVTGYLYGIGDNASNSDSRRCMSPTGAPSGFSEQWWLRNADGSFARMSSGSGRRLTNPTSWVPANAAGQRWGEHVGRWVADCAIAAGGQDGVQYDMVNDTGLFAQWPGWRISSRVPNIDMNRNGVRDIAEWGADETDRRWGEALRDLMADTRAAVGPDAIVQSSSGNGTSFYRSANGQMYEHGNSPSNGVFNDSLIRMMQQWDANHYGEQWSIMASQGGSSAQTNYKFMRHNLAATLMTNAEFAHGCGAPCNYTTQWWYDEYSVDTVTGFPTSDASRKGYLGKPNGPAVKLSSGLWRRDFDNGVALANNTNASITYSLGGTFRRINGTQDRAVNNGQWVSSVTLPAQDGLVLLR